MTINFGDNSTIPKVIQDELSIVTPQEDLDSIATLNSDPRHAFNLIVGVVEYIIGVDSSFGGKIIVFGGDFRQVLPVVPKDEMINLSTSMAIPWNWKESIVQLLEDIYPDIENHCFGAGHMVGRDIITPRNDDADKVNDKII
ncbi:hypothetical protein ACSBR1_029401 [Camellia fascicularis]